MEIPEDVENLYEAIEYVILNEKTLDNVNEFIKAQNVIVEFIENNKKNINEEKKLLDVFANPKTNKKEVFENYKKETLKKIKGAMQISEESERESWNKIYESINSKTYSNKLSENIITCAEMLEICSTIEE